MKKLLYILILLSIFSALLVACQGTSVASCAFLVGDGYPNADVVAVYYPGQSFTSADSDHKIKYLPCGDRNYLITDGSKVSNGIVVGDEITPLKAKTSTGTDILVQLSTYFQLNQNEEAMRAFYAYQYKFGAATDTGDAGGAVNNSSKEWLDLLGETFGSGLARTVSQCAFLTDDSIWQTGNPEQKEILRQCIVDNLKAELRTPTGYNNLDFFCGANGSQWPDPKNPGVGEFTCTPIDVKIDIVEKNPDQTNSSAEGSVELAKQRRAIAIELYGEDKAGCVLATLDTIAECKKSGGNCDVVINGGVCEGNPASVGNNFYMPLSELLDKSAFGQNVGSGTSATPTP